MVFKCCIPFCNGNYGHGEKVRAFAFPKDEELLAKWIRAIPRKFENDTPFKYSRVCEKHFRDEDFRKMKSHTNPDTGEVVRVELAQYRLLDGAVPSIFPPPVPPTPKTRMLKKWSKFRKNFDAIMQMEDDEATADSDPAEQTEFAISDLRELAELVRCSMGQSFWTVLERQEQAILILHLVDEPGPTVKYSVVIDGDFNVAAFVRGQPVKSVGDEEVAEVLSDFNSLERLLDAFVKMDGREVAPILCDVLQSRLKDLQPLCEENEGAVAFLSDQIGQLKTSKSGGSSRSWSVDAMVTWCLLYSVSPQAYGFLRGSRKLILPHPSRVQRLCLWYDVAFFEQQPSENFLASVGHGVQQLSKSDRIVILSIDHIDLQSHLNEDRGHRGSTGSRAFVFSIRSLLSDFEEVALVLLARTMVPAPCFHDVIKKIILKLELGFGYKVIAIVTDSTLQLNREAVSMFSEPRPKLDQICYPHPADKTRPLFFLFDTAHLLKGIRDGWLDQSDDGICLRFPAFLHHHHHHPQSSDVTTAPAEDDYTASFTTLRKLCALQDDHSPTRTLMSRVLNPTWLERRDLKLALQVFSEDTSQLLKTLGPTKRLSHVANTAEFVDIVRHWWSIVDCNVHDWPESSSSDCEYGCPIDSMDDVQVKFLEDFITWLDHWSLRNAETGRLAKETHSALRHTTYALTEISRYCLEELGFPHVLLAKLQGGDFQARLRRCHPLSSTSCCSNVSVRQMYESESGVRFFRSSLLPVLQESDLDFGTGALDGPAQAPQLSLTSVLQFEVSISDVIVRSPYPNIATVTYVASCCTHAFLRHFRCDFCKDNLLTDRNLEVPADDQASRMRSSVFGLLDGSAALIKLPTQAVTNAVFYADVVVQQLKSKANGARFSCALKQKDIAVEWAMFFLRDVDDLEAHCGNGHARDTVLRKLLHSAVGVLFNYNAPASSNVSVFLKGHKKCKLSTTLPANRIMMLCLQRENK